MGSGVDSYLHKKFKKQLSIQNDYKVSVDVVEKNQEKTVNCRVQCGRVNDTISVPNQSTNNQNDFFDNNKSSISVECIQSSISYDVSDNEHIQTQTLTGPSTAFTSSTYEHININKPKNTDQESSQVKEEIQPPPDRNSSGKYVCNYCNLVCSKPSVLQKHIRAHTNERPYPCHSCGFSFKTRSNLYKHCRSRTHHNRVMGNKAQELVSEGESSRPIAYPEEKSNESQDSKKPYKPRFHTTSKENIEDDVITHRINCLINNNSSIVNSSDPIFARKRSTQEIPQEPINNNDYSLRVPYVDQRNSDEPLNLSNKNRKRSMSEVAEPTVQTAQKSLIKELLLKNVYSNHNMQCQYCKMIFQTVTELELHEFRSCKGKPSGAKYTRSSSVNVASILTQNKNAFDSIPYLQNTTFPLNSPGPFLGKTRLVDSDKSKSFSFDDGLRTLSSNDTNFPFEKRTPVKLFGGEVKITQTTGETKKFKIDNKETEKKSYDYDSKVSENRVIKFSLQSGGTVLTNKPKPEARVLQGYDNTPMSPSIDLRNVAKPQITFEKYEKEPSGEVEVPRSPNTNNLSYMPDIMDFSQKAVRLLTPTIKHPSIVMNRFNFDFEKERSRMHDPLETQGYSPLPRGLNARVPEPRLSPKSYNPLNLLVEGKIVRYVPGMPGPVVAEDPEDLAQKNRIIVTLPKRVPPSPIVKTFSEPMDTSETPPPLTPDVLMSPIKKFPLRIRSNNFKGKTDALEIKTDLETKSPTIKVIEFKSPVKELIGETKKFSRPNSLALKPTTASLKQHHGLTPTKFNQILISPDTPRVNKKYVEHYLHGNYFSYLDLKSSTKPVYCTLNKTQPFYVPHFSKLSMYSEWRQQDTKADKFYVSAYDSRQRSQRYSSAGKTTPDVVINSSFKTLVTEVPSESPEKDDISKSNPVLGGYESNEDYTYIRGRGRGRYVCDQCGIRCKKPSMLKKHLRTHSVDRPYTCIHCNFSFKTKGNLTKHMKSKVHTKNYSAGSGSSSSTQQSGTQSSDSDTDDSGMDSSDESTRQQEHEAAYGLLSLSQKNTQKITQNDVTGNLNRSCSPVPPNDNLMSVEEPKNNYVSNMVAERPVLNFPASSSPMNLTDVSVDKTFVDVATQQVKLEKNSLAKSVASEFLKLATKNEMNPDGSAIEAATFGPINKDVNDLIVKPEGNKSCTICAKTFSKPSQLRLHMNIHYLERPFRCEPCSTSFRTKGHLQKHERSAGHHNKLSSSPALSSSEPRPFKCTDCNTSFRIHGHLAKHLRSKMHIMKLECLAKIPFGLYAELERYNCLLTEINTCDGDQCLESLKTLAKKVFVNEPNKLNQLEDVAESMDADP
ncbi:unnamed protein product [Brassicogethes aeneus]|uniref:C2H2-type domain-containing protein n=1 Tax=Brassicogethes aeneus TaxID=1431903 RepID=A0A9P0AWV5_BRAAE|nr:unnamed protein product [Brassicogethes aeneus]